MFNECTFSFSYAVPSSGTRSYTASNLSRTINNAPSWGGLQLRDNAPDPDPLNANQIIDGLTFIAFDGISDSIQVTLRGPTLDLIANGQLPTVQDER